MVILRAESHSGIDDHVPERDQRREVVGVVAVHVCQDDGGQVQPDHDLARGKQGSDYNRTEIFTCATRRKPESAFLT